MNREPKTGNVRLKDNTRKRLCKNVHGVVDTWSMLDDERVGLNVGTYEMIADIDMFGLAVIRVVDREGPGTIVVSGENKRRRAANLELSEGLTKPNAFLNSTCESDVFSLGG